ncbi:hypothetical protein PR048_030891 [Dryococelus australis]|uniref:Uncharacterized protein n=1 Tax=Dryococelus australis TaxID=614101 RepID=A0ABQ9GAA0_9NEOP|nr:hypothetical protein PR048_030891 [Dryococelus australis]
MLIAVLQFSASSQVDQNMPFHTTIVHGSARIAVGEIQFGTSDRMSARAQIECRNVITLPRSCGPTRDIDSAFPYRVEGYIALKDRSTINCNGLDHRIGVQNPKQKGNCVNIAPCSTAFLLHLVQRAIHVLTPLRKTRILGSNPTQHAAGIPMSFRSAGPMAPNCGLVLRASAGIPMSFRSAGPMAPNCGLVLRASAGIPMSFRSAGPMAPNCGLVLRTSVLQAELPGNTSVHLIGVARPTAIHLGDHSMNEWLYTCSAAGVLKTIELKFATDRTYFPTINDLIRRTSTPVKSRDPVLHLCSRRIGEVLRWWKPLGNLRIALPKANSSRPLLTPTYTSRRSVFVEKCSVHAPQPLSITVSSVICPLPSTTQSRVRFQSSGTCTLVSIQHCKNLFSGKHPLRPDHPKNCPFQHGNYARPPQGQKVFFRLTGPEHRGRYRFKITHYPLLYSTQMRSFWDIYGTGCSPSLQPQRAASAVNGGLLQGQSDGFPRETVADFELTWAVSPPPLKHQDESLPNVPSKEPGGKWGVAVLGTRPFVLREYVYVDALGRLDVYYTFPAPLHSIIWGFMGATVAGRLACSPPTKTNRVQSPAGSLRIIAEILASREKIKLELGDEIWLYGPCISALFPYSPRFTLIGSQDLVVKSHPNLPTRVCSTSWAGLTTRHSSEANLLTNSQCVKRTEDLPRRGQRANSLPLHCKSAGDTRPSPNIPPLPVLALQTAYIPTFQYTTPRVLPSPLPLPPFTQSGPGTFLPERLACSPPTKVIRVQSPAGSVRISACGNRAGRCRWSAGFLGDLLFPPPFHPGTALYSYQSPSSALKTWMLGAVQISSLAHSLPPCRQATTATSLSLIAARSSNARNSATHSFINSNSNSRPGGLCGDISGARRDIWNVHRTPSRAERTRSVIQGILQMNTGNDTTRISGARL